MKKTTIEALQARGCRDLDGLDRFDIAGLLEDGVSWAQVHKLISYAVANGRMPQFRGPTGWNEDSWKALIGQLVEEELVTWEQVAVAVIGELNPPQVGTSLASNRNIKDQYPARQAMRNVMEWFYKQDGTCRCCGARIHIEVDHIVGKDAFLKEGRDSAEADRLDNLQLLCRRCNVVKRDSHKLGGLTFATTQAALMWILLVERPTTRLAYHSLCRQHGLTMAAIRFDEAWAMAVWLAKAGKYVIHEDPGEAADAAADEATGPAGAV